MCSRAKLDIIKCWHKRLSHINYRDLFHIVNNERVRGIPKLSGQPKPISGKCMKGKQLKISHRKVKEINTAKPLNLLHMDRISPMHTESRNGEKYVLVVDDFSSYSSLCFLKEKSKTIEHLKSLCTRIQVEIGLLIMRIRSDTRREFDNVNIDLFYESKRIKHEYSTLRNP